MADIDKLKITIDAEECIGDGACVDCAAETFALDDDAKAILLEGSTDDRAKILEAAESCPVDVITVEDKDTGEKLYPED
ncbi:MAG: ferredoxin [Phycisphaerales bacterium]|nr:MAG: ferredoxin [Phycisphaerales bacterium]